ncbi:MAG: hypothetical protein AAFW46_06950 [Pseudomonadota bacterium]
MSSDPQETGSAEPSPSRPDPDVAAWTASRPQGYPLEFRTWIDPEISAELAGFQRRRFAPRGLPAGFWIGLATGLVGVGAALWFETISRWTALEPQSSWLFDAAGRPFIPVLYVALGFLSLGLIGRWAEQSLAARAVTRRMTARDLLAHPALLRLDGQGVTLVGEGWRSSYDWRCVEEVRPGEKAVWLFLGAGGAPIPRASVGGPAEVEALMTRIEAFREAASEGRE